MKKIELKAKVITPLHFESAIALTPLDFVIIDDMFYRIDFRKLSGVDHKLFMDITNAIGKDNYKHAHSLLVRNFDREFAIYSGIVGPKVLELYKNSNFTPDEQFHIMSLIRSDAPHFSPYIPGSSLKGVIRTAYLSCKLEKMDNRDDIVKFKGSPPGGVSRYLWQEGMILDSLFRLPGRTRRLIFDKYNDPFEDFAIADISLPKEFLEIAQINNAKLDRNGNIRFGKEYLVEAIPSALSTHKTDVEFEIIIRIKDKSPIQSWEDLKPVLDEYFLIELRREINQLSMTSRFYWQDIAESLDFLQRDIQDHTALIRVGRFCGNNFTAVRAFQKSQPKTRNLYDGGTPLGFVLIEFVKEEKL